MIKEIMRTNRKNAEERNEEEESEDFIENLNKLTPTTDQIIEEREWLAKLKMNIKKAEIAIANKVLLQHLGNTDGICKVVDAAYAMGRTIEERLGIKCGNRKEKNEMNDENRRI